MDDRHVSDADVRRIEREEELVTELQYLIQEVMNERGLTRAELADRLGIKRPRMTQLLGDNANPTLRTLVRVFDAMDEEIHISRGKRVVVDASSAKDAGTWQAPEGVQGSVATGQKSQPAPDILKALLRHADSGWQTTTEPVSNDNLGLFYDELLAASN